MVQLAEILTPERIIRSKPSDEQQQITWTALQALTVSNCDLRSLDPSISQIPLLLQLNASHNKISTIDHTIHSPSLRSLLLVRNKLTSVSSINVTTFNGLRKLDLSYNQISCLAILSSLPSLQVRVHESMRSTGLDVVWIAPECFVQLSRGDSSAYCATPSAFQAPSS